MSAHLETHSIKGHEFVHKKSESFSMSLKFAIVQLTNANYDNIPDRSEVRYALRLSMAAVAVISCVSAVAAPI